MSDAIVIGSGPNGLVAANMLADKGWDVVVLEASSQPGGAVRSSELIEPGFINDHCSAFYPLGAGSPVIKALDLESHGLKWLRAPLVLAHPTTDGTCPVLSTDLDITASSLDAYGTGDGDAWRRMFELWDKQRDNMLTALFAPFPPVRGGIRLARSMPPRELIRFARFAVLPVRRLGEEQFKSAQARRLLAGLALHSDLLPESALSGFFGWMLAALGQDVGFPVPEGGASGLSGSMVRRLESKGGVVQCNERVTSIVIRGGRAVGVKTASGATFSARKGVLADVDAVSLYQDLIPSDHVPASITRDIERFQWDHGTFKIDWTLDGPIPWTAERARRAGTVHISESVDALSVTASEMARSLIPANPFLLFGQHSMTDPTRSPEGKETAWAYTHVPLRASGDGGGKLTGKWDASETDQFTDRMEAQVEALAPGFRDLIRGRHVFTPASFHEENANLFHGALGGGTSELHQQLVFRPTPGSGRPETPIRGLFLASSSAHPGGGVHGACGANAAIAAVHGWQRRHAVRAVRWASKQTFKDDAQLVP